MLDGRAVALRCRAMSALRRPSGSSAIAAATLFATAGCGRSGLGLEDQGSADVGVRPEPVALAVGTGFACALSTVGTVKCWGTNDHGQLGIGANDARGDEPGELGEALPL